MRSIQTWLSAVALVTAIAIAAPASAQEAAPPSTPEAAPAAPPATDTAPPKQGADWPSYGNAPGGGQYSPLTQITAENVKKLKVAWVHQMKEKAMADTEKAGGAPIPVTPIHANGTLYYCTPLNRVYALDPATGKEKWVFDPHVAAAGEKPIFEKPRRAQGCRGVAYWEAATPQPGAACQKRIFKGYNNSDVFAIDADTGKACTDFGAGKGHPGYVTGLDFENYGSGVPVRTGMKSPPTVIGDVLVAASGSADSAVNADDGIIRGYDVRTGELKWSFNPVPAGRETETGAVNAWAPLSIDAERGLVFVPTTAASPDLWGGTRLFDVPYEDATIALKAETGEPAWHFQTIHHDIYDYDLPAQPMAVTIKKDGKDIPVVIQQTKLGFVFVFDRDTGVPIFPIEERPVPKSDMEGEQASATQPFPVLPEEFGRTKLTEDDIWGLTPIDRAWCKKQFKSMRYDGVYTPPSERGTILYPWTGGAGNWGGAAYDPKNNLLIVKAINVAQYTKVIKIDPNEKPHVPKVLVSYVTKGAPYRIEYDVFTSPLGIPCTAPPWGMLTAIDMDSGKIKWQIPYGQSRRYGINVPAFLKWGSPIWGGPIVTASGLIFISGAMDQKIRALDVATGTELWQTTLGPGGAAAVPMTYMAGGKQYVAIAAGGATMEEMNRGAAIKDSEAIVAYTLDDK